LAASVDDQGEIIRRAEQITNRKVNLGEVRKIRESEPLLKAQGCVGSSVPSAQQRQNAVFGMTVTGWGFDLLQWESSSLREKLQAWWTQPAAKLPTDEAAQLVRDYLDRAQHIGAVEWEIEQRLSAPSDRAVGPDEPTVADLQDELEHLRTQQQAIEKGIGLSGRPWPPVKFSFTEPPKKMVVSPRDRIETVYSQMLSADISQSAIEASEETIYYEHDFSGYITNIGGLGAYPAMVVDRASI